MKKPFSPNLCTFFIGQLLSSVEENPSRTRKNSILGIDNIGYGEHISTFLLSICNSNQILQQYGIENFVPFYTFSRFRIFIKNGYLPN
jgi:hypothetical protein